MRYPQLNFIPTRPTLNPEMWPPATDQLNILLNTSILRINSKGEREPSSLRPLEPWRKPKGAPFTRMEHQTINLSEIRSLVQNTKPWWNKNKSNPSIFPRTPFSQANIKKDFQFNCTPQYLTYKLDLESFFLDLESCFRSGNNSFASSFQTLFKSVTVINNIQTF